MHGRTTRQEIELTVLPKVADRSPSASSLTANGKIASDGSACTMARGRAKRVRIDVPRRAGGADRRSDLESGHCARRVARRAARRGPHRHQGRAR